MKKKICFRCKKTIEENSNFYSFTEWNNKKVVAVNYTHRVCWDEFLQKLSSLDKAQGFLSRINTEPLEKLGLLKPQEVRI